MSFAADIKDFASGFATGWKLMTPTPAEVRERENQQLAKEREEFRRTAIGSNARRSGGGPDEDTSVSPRSDTSTMADVSGTTTDPAAEDLQPHEKALLNAISGPESAGRYNIRYTPKGGATFEETGTHPAIYEPTKEGKRSSAAGRYQFVKSTWDKIAGKGVPFTRENQDRMALKLARQDYETRTGRNLDADLKANGLTPSIMRQLAPTWAGFGGTGGRSKALNIYQASLNRYSGDTSTKAGLPRYTGPDEDRSEVVQTDEEGAPVVRTARPSAVPLPPVRPASLATSAVDDIPVRRVRTTPAAAAAIDSATGLPIPADDPRLDTSAIDRAHGRRSALELTPGVNDDELMYPQYAARGGLVAPENAADTTDDTSEDADMRYLYGSDSADYTSGRRSSGYGARELVDGGSIPKMISTGMDYLTQKFGLTSGAIPSESPQAQRGVQAFAAGAGTPSHEEVDQIMQTVDPNGTLPKEQRHVVGWGNLYHYFSDRGDAQGAARASAAMLMYSKNVSRQAGVIAMAALEKGDFKRASDAVAAAYDYLPDGKALRVKNAGPGGVEYETVDVDGKRIEKGKIKREELADIAKGMVDGTLWFQSVNAASAPVDKAAQRKAGESKVIDQFEEGIPEDTRGVEDLPAAQRKLWSQLPSTYRREQERKWRDLKKQDKTEGEAGAEAEFYSDPEVRDQFRATLSDDKLKQFENMSDKAKTNAIARFEKKRTQDFNEFKFDKRLEVNAENRDRAEALKLFGMAQRYGMWQTTREQIMTENERRAAQRQLEEEGRGKRQELSIAQQNKVQENIDRRILEKRTATLDGAGAKLTAPEARDVRRLGAINAREEQGLTALDERLGTGVTPDEEAGQGEVAAQRALRGKRFEEGAMPIKAQTGFESVTTGPDKADRKFDAEEYKALNADIVKRWDIPDPATGKKRAPLTEADQHVLSSIGSDILRTSNVTPEYAGNLTMRAMHPQTPLRILPDRSIQIGEGRTAEKVFLSGTNMARLADLRAKAGVTPRVTATGDVFDTGPRRSIREQIDAPAKARREARSALDLSTAAARQPDGSQYAAMREQLGDWYREGMTFEQMQQTLRDKYAAEGTRQSIMRRGTR